MFRLMEAVEPRTLLSTTPVINPGGPMIPAPSSNDSVTIHVEATDKFSKTVAIIPRTGLDVSGTINWGDGTAASAASFVDVLGNAIRVHGTHKYATSGHYKIVVRLTERPKVIPGQPTPMFILLVPPIDSKAVVKPDDDGGVSLTETAGDKFTAKVGAFDFSNVDLLLSATIDWGDGKTTAGTLKLEGGLASGEYDVIGTHTYAKAGAYKVHVIVNSRLVGQTQPSGTVADFFSKIKVN